MKILRSTALLIFLLLFSLKDYANGIQITNASIAGRNDASTYITVEFDLSWDNSWRDATNWDATWVFIKWRLSSESTTAWSHATLETTGHTIPTGYTSSIPTDEKGIFIYRSSTGTGTNTLSGVQLRWDYGADGLSSTDAVDIEVMGVEMVYVPQGSFYVGSGGDGNYSNLNEEYGSLTNGSWASGNTIPLQITSENAITIASSAGNLWGTIYSASTSQTGRIGESGTLPASYPKGYDAFYCMKYEVSQEQYVDFLNHLDRTQQDRVTRTDIRSGYTAITNRYVMSNSSALQYRNGIRCDATISSSDPVTFYCDLDGDGTGNEADDGQNIACNWLLTSDMMAYLDWSGFRPMTELEFEKACRGTASAVANQFPWGNSTIYGSTFAKYVFVTGSEGKVNESLSTFGTGTTGNALYSGNRPTGFSGPFRTGIFATLSSTKIIAGSSYYGIMELSGNVAEMVVAVTTSNDRAYTGAHGDGEISSFGFADTSNWPTAINNYKGGSWNSIGTGEVRVSSRYTMNMTNNGEYIGGRGVRTAP